jgi:hypothetical protein
MRGLDPRIHHISEEPDQDSLDYCEAMDPRVKPAGDTREMGQ